MKLNMKLKSIYRRYYIYYRRYIHLDAIYENFLIKTYFPFFSVIPSIVGINIFVEENLLRNEVFETVVTTFNGSNMILEVDFGDRSSPIVTTIGEGQQTVNYTFSYRYGIDRFYIGLSLFLFTITLELIIFNNMLFAAIQNVESIKSVSSSKITRIPLLRTYQPMLV